MLTVLFEADFNIILFDTVCLISHKLDILVQVAKAPVRIGLTLSKYGLFQGVIKKYIAKDKDIVEAIIYF